MAKQTALRTATIPPKTAEEWVSENPKIAAQTEKTSRLVVEIPADLHRQLKGKCGMEGTKIKDVIQQLLEQHLAGENKSV